MQSQCITMQGKMQAKVGVGESKNSAAESRRRHPPSRLLLPQKQLSWVSGRATKDAEELKKSERERKRPKNRHQNQLYTLSFFVLHTLSLTLTPLSLSRHPLSSTLFLALSRRTFTIYFLALLITLEMDENCSKNLINSPPVSLQLGELQ